MRIVGKPRIAMDDVISRVTLLSPTMTKPVHNRFLWEMIPALWRAGLRYGIDPVGLVAQSALETGWGRFEGNVRWWFHNTCGLKVRDVTFMRGLLESLPVVVDVSPPSSGASATHRIVVTDDTSLVHQVFWDWEIGAHAHAQHVCAYANHDLPDGEFRLSPRARHVTGKYLENWSEFGGGNWAPRADYGADVEAIMRRLLTAPAAS